MFLGTGSNVSICSSQWLLSAVRWVMKSNLSFLFSKVSGSKSLQHSSKGPFKMPGAFYGASPDLSHYLCNEDIQTGNDEKKDSEHLLFIKLECLKMLGCSDKSWKYDDTQFPKNIVIYKPCNLDTSFNLLILTLMPLTWEFCPSRFLWQSHEKIYMKMHKMWSNGLESAFRFSLKSQWMQRSLFINSILYQEAKGTSSKEEQ